MKRKAILISIFLMIGTLAFAQQQAPQTPEEREKQMYEAIQKQVDQLAESLDLEDWQIFYADSILTHDYGAMQKEFEAMSGNKVGNSDLYISVQDKWNEQIYNSFQKILSEDQWAKYLKQGAARAKKARDKRAQKRNK